MQGRLGHTEKFIRMLRFAVWNSWGQSPKVFSLVDSEIIAFHFYESAKHVYMNKWMSIENLVSLLVTHIAIVPYLSNGHCPVYLHLSLSSLTVINHALPCLPRRPQKNQMIESLEGKGLYFLSLASVQGLRYNRHLMSY